MKLPIVAVSGRPIKQPSNNCQTNSCFKSLFRAGDIDQLWLFLAIQSNNRQTTVKQIPGYRTPHRTSELFGVSGPNHLFAFSDASAELPQASVGCHVATSAACPGCADGAFKNGCSLPPFDAGEPLQKLLYGCVVLEVFKEGGHGHARATKHPRAAELARVPFDNRTPLPVRHAETSLSQRTTCSRSARLMPVMMSWATGISWRD